MVNIAYEPALFVGREAELAQIGALLTDPACRLLTLVGPGGVGKTRLALEAAQQLTVPGGVHIIPFQPLTSPDDIVSAIADAVGFQFYSGVEPQQQLLDYFREKALLLVLDNLEHLLEGATLLSAILAAAPAVRILATSRERLNLREEWVLEVGGLPYPANAGETDIESYGAVALFMQHARRVKVGFAVSDTTRPTVVRICRLVGGMPLGIELAAGWVRVLAPEAIADEIERSLGILETPARNVEPRHRTMRAAFEPTWQRLSGDERDVFMKLSVFRGGFTRKAAEAVAGASLPVLASLADRSLIRLNKAERYDLHELLRQYAEERLMASGEADAAHDAHCTYYARFLERLAVDLKGPNQVRALDEIEEELDNVRLSWRRAVTHGMGAEIGRSMDCLARFCQMRTRHWEALETFEMAFNRFGDLENELAGQLLMWLGWFYQYWDREREFKCVQKGATLLHQVDADTNVVMPLRQLIYFVDKLGGYETLRDTYRQHLAAAKETDDEWGTAWALQCMGELALHNKEFAEAQPFFQESLARFRALGDRWGASWPTGHLGLAAQGLKNYEEALYYHQDHLGICREIGDLGGIRFALRELGIVAYVLGKHEMSRRYFDEALSHSRMGHSPWYAKGSIDVFGAASHLITDGQTEQAVELLALLRHHDAMPGTRDTWSRWLQTLQAELAPEVFAAAVRRGEAHDLETVAAALVQHFPALGGSKGIVPTLRSHGLQKREATVKLLTERELAILYLLADGLNSQEVAQHLYLSVSTIRWYLRQIYAKLAAHSRSQAIARARELKLLL